MTQPAPTHGTIDVETIGRTRRLTINRPAKKNALDSRLMALLLEEISAAEANEAIHVIVLRGAGGNFSSGYDISEYENDADSQEGSIAKARAIVARAERILNCRIPIIAQVSGYCLAGATDIVLASDFLFAGRIARIGHPAVRRFGAVPPWSYWIYRIGVQQAKRLMLQGELISGEDARRIGLALHVMDDEALDDAVLEFADRMGRVSRDCLTANKDVLNVGVDLMGGSRLTHFSTWAAIVARSSPQAGAFSRARTGEQEPSRELRRVSTI